MTDEPLDDDPPLSVTSARARRRDRGTAATARRRHPPPARHARRGGARARRSDRPFRRWKEVLGAAAAVAIVVLGGWALLSSGSTTRSDKSGSAGAIHAGSSGAAAASPRSLGEVSNPRQLLAWVRHAIREPVEPPATGASVPGSRCSTSLEPPAGVTAQPFASATYRGAAAVVFVAHDKNETLIYVLDRSDCRLLTAQFFHG